MSKICPAVTKIEFLLVNIVLLRKIVDTQSKFKISSIISLHDHWLAPLIIYIPPMANCLADLTFYQKNQ